MDASARPSDGPREPPRGHTTFSYGVDADGTVAWASEGITDVLGWRPAEIVGRLALDLVHPDDLARGLAERRIIYESGHGASAVLRALRSDGSYVWLSLDSVPELDPQEGVVATRVSARALLHVDEMSPVLAEAESRYRLLALNTFDVVVHQVDGVVEWVSPSVAALLGYSADELIGTTTVHLWNPDDLDAVTALRARALAGERCEGLFRIRHKDGRDVWLDVAASPDGNTGHPGVVVSLRDATARVLAEQELRAREADYRLVAENAVDLVVRSHLDGTVAWVSPSCQRLLGYTSDELVGLDLLELLHPDDRAERTWSEVIDGRSAEYVARYRHKDGHYVWLEAAVGPATDGDGSVVGIVGSARDVTAEVQARQALEASEEMFRRVMAESNVGMVVVDLEGRFLAANRAICRIIDRDEDWFRTHSSHDLVHPRSREASASLLEGLRTGTDDVEPRVMRLRRGDDSEAWVRRTAVLVRHEDGSPRYVVAQIEDLSAERAAQDQLAYQALHDPLTGLRNRAWILEMLETEMRGEAAAAAVGVLFVGVDNIKVVNDSLGHDAGDQVIREVGRRVGRVLRPGDHLGRFGGDEYVVVVPRTGDPQALERLAERLLDGIGSPMEVDGHRVVVSASIGIAVSRGDATTSSLLRDADSALSRAKASGRSRWHFFDERMHADAVARLTVEDELRRAVAEHELVVHYQPIVSLADRRIVGHEALVRWQHPTRGLVPPLDFLPVAEESGLIVDVGHEVLDQVCSLLASRTDLPGPISVNKSPLQITRPGWRARFLDVVERHGIDPRRLVVEVTETAALSLDDASRDDLDAIRTLGIGLHVDDFGTGYSSISLLRDLPVTGLKLDASFTRRLTGGDEPADVLAAGLAGLARGLHLDSVAEGVETEEQAQILLAQGWTHGQGWLFGRPRPEPIVG